MATTSGSTAPRAPGPGISRGIGIAVLLLIVAFSSWVRIRTTLADPGFRIDRPDGLMRSDPGLLFYILERVLDGGGLPPSDFRSDPRVEYPLKTDLPALDSVSQEFPIAWAYLLAGEGMPLHLFCLYFMAIVASLTAAGVYLLALELTGKVRWACLATALFALLPASYRTLGFVLMREDFALPFFALHLALFARAARLRTVSSMLLCALPLAIALASWHAMGFVVTLEVACLFLGFLATGENPFSVPRAWIVPAFVAAASLGVPILRRTDFLLSLPAGMAAGLLVAALLRRRGLGRPACGAAAVGSAAAVALLRAVAEGGRAEDYGHVWDLLLAKIRFLGTLPADPRLLPFDARLMWEGPFASLATVGEWHYTFGAALWILPLALAAWAWKGEKRDALPAGLLLGFLGAGLAATWLVMRVMPLPGILLPVAAALLLSRLPARRLGAAAMGAALLVQGLLFAWTIAHYQILWYQPSFLTPEYRSLLQALPGLVPEGEAVAADPVLSTAILATTRHPIVLQPKWEEVEARRRTRDILDALFHAPPGDLRRLLLERYRCRYLAVDRWTLWVYMRYIAGVPLDLPRVEPGTAAASLLTDDAEVLSSVPGYRLLYRSPATILDDTGNPTDLIRLFELSRLPGDAAAPPPASPSSH